MNQLDLQAYYRGVPTFGERFKELRDRAGLTQDAVATRLKLKKPTPISLMEGPRQRLVPKPSRIRKLAAAVEAEPWELLEGVETEYDRLRSGAPPDRNVTAGPSTVVGHQGTREAQVLLRRIERERQKVAATREKLGRKIGEIGLQFGELAALLEQLPGGPDAVARRERPGSPPHRRRRRGRDDRKRPPEAPSD